MKTKTPPYNITTGIEADGTKAFTAIGAPTIWHRGYKIEQWSHHVVIYDMSGDRPTVIWEEYVGDDAFDDCVKWIDLNLPEDGTIVAHFQSQYDYWVKENQTT